MLRLNNLFFTQKACLPTVHKISDRDGRVLSFSERHTACHSKVEWSPNCRTSIRRNLGFRQWFFFLIWLVSVMFQDTGEQVLFPAEANPTCCCRNEKAPRLRIRQTAMYFKCFSLSVVIQLLNKIFHLLSPADSLFLRCSCSLKALAVLRNQIYLHGNHIKSVPLEWLIRRQY